MRDAVSVLWSGYMPYQPATLSLNTLQNEVSTIYPNGIPQINCVTRKGWWPALLKAKERRDVFQDFENMVSWPKTMTTLKVPEMNPKALKVPDRRCFIQRIEKNVTALRAGPQARRVRMQQERRQICQ